MVAIEHEIRIDDAGQLVRRFSLEEFESVAEALPDDRFELINGEIVTAPPPDRIHIEKTNRLIELFAHHVEDISKLGCQVSGSNAYYSVPVELRQQWVEAGVPGPHSVCPDASICYRDYLRADRKPPALLRREHIDRDLVIKPDVYASLEIPTYWAVDRRDSSVWVHLEPVSGKYTLREQLRANHVLPCPGLEFLRITPDQIFEG
jgi:Uma2 family endonuclease